MIAPRNCLIYSPERDRFADIYDIKNCLSKAKTAWIESDELVFNSPDDICRFQKDQQNVVINWLDQVNK
jgi:hypothetical protein